ncbi:MAG: sigma-70 family RNA polymerase sigma factor [bacterium]|nr:sigma-70 family RNA polymerase sigma factor [bacterium]
MAAIEVVESVRLERVRWESFEAFYRDYRHDLYRVLTSVLRDSELAQEAADEAMLRTFERWATVKRYANPRGWTYRVGLNWARSRLRKKRREVVGTVDRTAGRNDQDPDTMLLDLLAALPIREREVVVFRYLFDLSTAHTAEMLDVAEGTVKSRLHRALNQLREGVDDDS